jgi:spore coat protein U-like protein
MTSGANSLAYELYRDQTHLALFGNSQPTGWHRTGTGGQEDVTIYGWINTGLNPPVGNYTQTVTVTVEY